MWNWFDLIFPWGIGLLAMVLGIWGAIKGKTMPAKVISVVTGLIFIAGVPVTYGMRMAGTSYDYETMRGLRVRAGKINTCPKAEIQKLETDLVAFWAPKYPGKDVGSLLKGKYLICKDEEKLSISQFEMFFRGYSTNTTAVIGWKDSNYRNSLFRHEVTHLIFFGLGIPWDEAAHHKLMADSKLGA